MPAHIATTRVMIVDDHPTVCAGLEYRISAQADMTVCGHSANVQDALRQITECDPDIVIVDISLKDSDGLELIRILRSRNPQIRSLVHSMHDEESYANRCLHAGAMGYVNKESDPQQVIDAIRTVRSGRVFLSPQMSNVILSRRFHGTKADVDPVDKLTERQLEVFRLIGQGYSTSEIANRLHISVHTVETHRDNIKHRLSIETGVELTRRAILWTKG